MRWEALCWKLRLRPAVPVLQDKAAALKPFHGDAGDRFLQGEGCLEQGMQRSMSSCRALGGKLHFIALPIGGEEEGQVCSVLWQVLSLSPEELERGLVTCSTGNHALAVLHACSWLSESNGGVQPCLRSNCS